MSDNPFAAGDNPYQAPVSPSISTGSGGTVSDLDRAAEMLRQTKPWVRFISVMLFIGAFFLALGGFLLVVAGGPGMPGKLGPGIGLVYIVMSVLYIAPGVFLWMYADRIGTFLHQQTTLALASALEAQKSFWKFVGIVTLVVLVIYGVILVFAVLFGMLAALR